MVGLQRAKQQVADLVAAAEIDAFRAEEGLDSEDRKMHMVFTGNPGTGKTTMAEQIARVYHGLGLLPRSTVHKVRGVELIDPYQNGTPERVAEEFGKAKGGVLFIDEAYGMATEGGNDAGKQAADTLLGLMDANPDTVVIMAGYPGQMDRVFGLNAGLDRRFPTDIEFQDYSHKERVEIMGQMLGENRVADRAAQAALDDAIYDTGQGNAGDVEILRDKILVARQRRLSSELAGLPKEQRRVALTTVTLDDVVRGHQDFLVEARVGTPIRGSVVPTGRRKAS